MIQPTDNMTTLVIADSQGKYFEDHLEEHHILSLFNSSDKIEDLSKYSDLFPSFNTIIIQIGSNNCLIKEDATIILTKMQQLYEEICMSNAKTQICEIFTVLLLDLSSINI